MNQTILNTLPITVDILLEIFSKLECKKIIELSRIFVADYKIISKHIFRNKLFWIKRLEFKYIISDITGDDWKDTYYFLTQDSSNLLIESAKNGLRRELSILLSNVTNQTVCCNDAMRVASQNGHVELVKLLISHPKVNPSFKGDYPIRFAAANGHVDVVKFLLLDSRVDPGSFGNYAIRIAAENGHTEVVKLLLLDSRVNPNTNDNYAIIHAAANGHTEVVKLLLLDPRVDPSDRNNRALRLAAANEHVEVVRLLLLDPRVSDTLDIIDRFIDSSVNSLLIYRNRIINWLSL